jgi:hypothetical protein
MATGARLSWGLATSLTNPRCWYARGTGSTGPLLTCLTCDSDARLPARSSMAVEVVWNGASAVGTEDSAVEALLQTCSGSKEANCMDHDGGAWWSEKGSLAANFASGRGLAVSKLIDSGVH